MKNIQVIIGSVREGRLGKRIADWLLSEIGNNPDFNFEVIDLKDWHLPMKMETALPASGSYSDPQTIKWATKVAKADGYIFITPEYNHGYPASLKNAIDHLYLEWQKKPVAFVGYGVLGAARSIEQLAQVTSQIGMMPLQMSSINIISLRDAFDEDGKLMGDHVKGNIEKMIEQLNWWADALKTARNKECIKKALV